MKSDVYSPENIVEALHLILLGRRPDDQGKAYFSARVRKEDSPICVTDALRRTDEFSFRFASVLLKNRVMAATYLAEGDEHRSKGDYLGAQANYDVAIALNPHAALAYGKRGKIAEKLRRNDEAIACYDVAILLQPEYAQAHADRSIALARAGLLNEARAAADRAVALQADLPEGWIARVHALSLLGLKDEASASLEKARAAGADPFELELATAAFMEAAERGEEALAACRRAMDLDPAEPEPHYRAGAMLERAGRADEALVCYDRATALVPDNLESWFRGGALLALKFGLDRSLTFHDTGADLAPLDEPITYILYSETSEANIGEQLGQPEYSYFFVREGFRRLLERHARCIVVTDPGVEVDEIYDRLSEAGTRCIFLSFAPPHRSFLEIRCPTIPVFAWEFDTVPTEDCGGGRLDDWRWALSRFGCAIVHSVYACRSVTGAMYPGFPVLSVPAPIWDRLQKPKQTGGRTSAAASTEFDVSQLFDSRSASRGPAVHGRIAAGGSPSTGLRFDSKEVVFTTVFNPGDGRKNWHSLLRAFCTAFADQADATLVLKLVCADAVATFAVVQSIVEKMPRFRCRVVAIGDYLSARDYASLIEITRYVVNTSHGEGQCLPLMEFMALGKPAIAPAHTSMAEYIDESCACIIESRREPTFWPHDLNHRMRAHRFAIDWDSIVHALKSGYEILAEQPERYRAMSAAAIESQRRFCSEKDCYDRLRQVVALKFALDAAHTISLHAPLPSASEVLPEKSPLAKRLIECEALAMREFFNREWLRKVHTASLDQPRWWVLMPEGWRRRRELAYLRKLGLFNAEAYLASYPDVVEAGMDPLRHYLQHGMHERREIAS